MPSPLKPKPLSRSPWKATLPPLEARFRAEGFRVIAGVDEAGRGPWAGPVVAAAVILKTSRLVPRIDDSKRLTPAQRERAFAAICDHAQIGLGLVSAEAIDRVNILQATLQAMQEALQNLPQPPELALIDGSAAPVVSVPCRTIVHGDARSYVIACASIVAKVTRDRLMRFYHRLYPHYDFQRHKGYGTARHATALASFGPSLLHRFSFQPVAAAQAVVTVTDPRPIT